MDKPAVMKPAKLEPGEQIGIISPAGPVDESELQFGIDLLAASGFKVCLAPHVYSRNGYLAGRDEGRLEDLHAMFQDTSIKAIFCARGGYGTLRLLKDIRYELIKENPKIFMGYSDITALLWAIFVKTGLATIHGPVVRELGSKDQGNWRHALGLLRFGGHLDLSLTNGSILFPGKATGPLIGGNLTLICHLMGTPFLPSLDGCILFLEEKGEPTYRLDRMVTHLALTGALAGISGLVAGEFEGCGDPGAINALLLDRLLGLNIPVVTGLPIGHGPKNLALPLGLTAELDTDRRTLCTNEACVKG